MKVITSQLATHLGEAVTTLATLWKVKREDGVILGFTDHDQDIVYNAGDGDGSVTYYAATGFTPSATDTQSQMGTDNLEVTAFLDVSAITDLDLRAGLYNFCVVEIRIVNYADLTQGELKIRKGTVGNVVMKNGVGSFEIRGLGFRFGTAVGQTYGPVCRAELGDAKCGVKLTPTAIAASPTGLTEVGNTVTVVTTVAHKLSIGQLARIAGAGDAGYNGTFTVVTVPTTTSLTVTNGTAGLPASGGGTVGLQQSGAVTGVVDRRTLAVSGIVGSGESVDARSSGPLFTGGVWEPSTQPGAGGEDGWAGEADALTNNNVFATQKPPQTALRAATFGFPVPLNAVITGVKLIIRRKSTNGATKDFSVRLIKNGNTDGQNKADVLLIWPASNTDKEYGGPGDTWQVTLSPTTVNDPDFGFEILPTGGGGAIDSFSSIIYWSLNKTGYFSDGVITFTSGANNGKSMEVTSWDGTTLRLFEGMPFDIQAGDTFTITPGCNLAIGDCQDKFVNIVNFRGEPFIPGMDAILNYPNADGSIS